MLPSWSFDVPNAMDFAGAHGDEVVRDVLIDNQVSDKQRTNPSQFDYKTKIVKLTSANRTSGF